MNDLITLRNNSDLQSIVHLWGFRGSLVDFNKLNLYLSKDSGVVYAINFENGYTKIGVSTNLFTRVNDIKNSVKAFSKIVEIAFTKEHFNFFNNEELLHKIFSRFKVEGEYFNISISEIEKYLILLFYDVKNNQRKIKLNKRKKKQKEKEEYLVEVTRKFIEHFYGKGSFNETFCRELIKSKDQICKRNCNQRII